MDKIFSSWANTDLYKLRATMGQREETLSNAWVTIFCYNTLLYARFHSQYADNSLCHVANQKFGQLLVVGPEHILLCTGF